MSNKYKFILSDIPQVIELPIELKWDFYGRDDSIEVYQEQVIEEVIGVAEDFEILRFSHEEDSPLTQQTSLTYEFYFYNGLTPTNQSVLTSTPANWVCSYLPEGFTSSEIYYYRNPFTKSFFKLDFYDTNSGTNQTNYFTVILPVQQGKTETASISPALPNVQIKKPLQILDFVGDKEGFFLYWLRKKEFLDINTFYMSAKFFDARLGVFVKLMNTPQSTLPNKFVFNGDDKFYYKVVLDYTKYTYEIYDINTSQRVGTTTPIKWYEYINP